MTPISPDALNIPEFARAVTAVARLIASAAKDSSFKALHSELSTLCRFDNLIVYLFDGSAPPELLGSNLAMRRLRGQMEEFTHGLFLLDPFVIEAGRGATGVLRLRDIMPDDFLDSEFYHHHYTFTDVRDEVRYIIPVDRHRTVHIFVEREIRSSLFADEELALLVAVRPVIDTYMAQWIAARERAGSDQAAPKLQIDLAAQIAKLGPLTGRECQVVELVLRGFATKSIAYALGIEVGTATNHKRNIHAKLSIHTQAQLFQLFLQSLSRSAA